MKTTTILKHVILQVFFLSMFSGAFVSASWENDVAPGDLLDYAAWNAMKDQITTNVTNVNTNITDIANLSTTVTNNYNDVIANDTSIGDFESVFTLDVGNGRAGIGTSPSVALHVDGNVIGDTPTASNHLTTKAYVDSEISSASPANATTSTAGVIILDGDITGTYNSVQIAAEAVGTSEVVNDSLTASDLAENSVGNSEMIDAPTFTDVTTTNVNTTCVGNCF